MICQSVIDEAVCILREEASPAKIILFGSYARGDANSNSDLDFLIIHRGPVDKRRESVRLREALWLLKVPVDVM